MLNKFLIAVSGTFTALSLTGAAEAAVLNFGLDFETQERQSIWDTGEAFRFGNEGFVGPTWNETGSTTVLGTRLEASTEGRVGLEYSYLIDGGSINAKIPVNLSLTTPNVVRPGELFTIQSGFSLAEGAKFDTSSPNLSLGLGLILEAKTKAIIDPPLLGSYEFDIASVDASVQLNLTEQGFDLLNNRINTLLKAPPFNGLATFKVGLPVVTTNSQKSEAGDIANQLVSSGKDDFVKISLDLDALATKLIPQIPDLEFKQCFPASNCQAESGRRLALEYNIVDVSIDTFLNLSQEFALSNALSGLLTLENGNTVPFRVGEDITLTAPDDFGDFLGIDATLGLDAILRNLTNLDLGASLGLLAGKFSATVEGIPFFADVNVDLGPLFKTEFSRSIPFNIFDNEFNLGGFNRQAFSFGIPLAGAGELPGGGGTPGGGTPGGGTPGGGTPGGGTPGGGTPGGGTPGGTEPKQIPEPSLILSLVAFGVFALNAGFLKRCKRQHITL